MHYVLALSVITLYLYFRFGKKALAGVLVLIGLFALSRGFIALTIPLLVIAYILAKNDLFAGKIKRRETSRQESGSKSSGQFYPTISSRYLDLFLDADTGDIVGQITAGPLVGRILGDLTDPELKQLKQHYEQRDKESAALFYAYLDKVRENWQQSLGAEGEEVINSAAAAKPLSQYEAYSVLGLSPPATAEAIKQAHRRLMKKYHPDQGGSAIIAAKINMAKEQLG